MTNLTQSQKAFYLEEEKYEVHFSQIRQQKIQEAEEFRSNHYRTSS